MLKIDAPIRNPTTFAPVTVPERNSRDGSSGCDARDSIATKAISRPIATANRPRTYARLVQPCWSVPTSA